MRSADRSDGAAFWDRQVLTGGLVLVVGIALVFLRTRDFAFLNFDDYSFISQNPNVATGLTWDNMVWAWQTGYFSAWLPLTWLSHMIDVSLFGLNPAGHHLMSVTLHTVVSLAFFLVLIRLTGNTGAAFVAAGIFAWHPLHIEPVAWIAARKDLLSVAYLLIALWFHVGYARFGGRLRYAGVAIFLVLGLLSKAMAVTFPLILLLIDYWPLGRFRIRSSEVPGGAGLRGVLLEKIPLLVLALIAAGMHFIMADSHGTVSSLSQISLATRLANLPVAYGHYLLRFLVPTNLSLYYPYPPPPPLWVAVALWAGLIGITAMVVRARQRPWLVVGWLWFIIYLIPASGLLHQAGHLVADRYVYFPLAGLAVMVVWGGRALLGSRWNSPWPSRIVAGLILAALLGQASATVGHWRNNESVYRQALSVDPQNDLAHQNLAGAYYDQRNWPGTIYHAEQALAMTPYFGKRDTALLQELLAEAYGERGAVFLARGDVDSAFVHLRVALDLKPENRLYRINLGLVENARGNYGAAMVEFQKCLAANPADVVARYDLACSYALAGRLDEAFESLQSSVAQGFRDWTQVMADPDLAPVRALPAFRVWQAAESPQTR